MIVRPQEWHSGWFRRCWFARRFTRTARRLPDLRVRVFPSSFNTVCRQLARYGRGSWSHVELMSLALYFLGDMRKHINTQQHLSKRSSKSLVSNVKYMSVTWLSICHCTSEFGWQTDCEDTPLHHNWVRWLKRHLVLGGWPLDYCEILGWSRLVLYLVMSPHSHQSAL